MVCFPWLVLELDRFLVVMNLDDHSEVWGWGTGVLLSAFVTESVGSVVRQRELARGKYSQNFQVLQR